MIAITVLLRNRAIKKKSENVDLTFKYDFDEIADDSRSIFEVIPTESQRTC